MPWVCPVCGFKNDDTTALCLCGYQADESVMGEAVEAVLPDDAPAGMTGMNDRILEPSAMMDTPPAASPAKSPAKARDIKIRVAATERPARKPAATPAPAPAGGEDVIKEIDAWRFVYSQADGCIYLGTPALQAFRLRLSLDDIEELRDLAYLHAGVKKPREIEKITLAGADLADVVELVDQVIDEKRSQVKIRFTAEDLQKIADLVNAKLERD